MATLGGLLVVLGLGSLILPLFDMQFSILEPIDPYQPWAGIALAIVGAVIVGLPYVRGRGTAGGPPSEPPAA
jgi:drug/metabolite transporter (DMT)-like permease